MKKNNAIEFFRFLMAWLMGFMHFNKRCEVYDSNAFMGAYIGAEFFFLLSGFFLMKRYYDRKQFLIVPETPEEKSEQEIEETKEFLFSKLKRIFPQYAISFIITILVIRLIYEWEWDLTLKKGFFEFFMLQNVGIYDKRINAPAWYICAMLIASYFIYYLIQKNDKKFLAITAPAIVILIYSYLSANFGHLSTLSHIVVCVTTGMMRAFAGVTLGCITYSIYQKYFEGKQVKHRFLYTYVEIILWMILLIRMYGTGHGKADFIMVFIMAALILFTFSGRSYLSTALNTKCSAILGNLSYAVYLNHWVVMKLLTSQGGVKGYTYGAQCAIYFIFVMILSILTTFLVREIRILLKW